MKKGFIILAAVLIIGLYVLNKVNTARQLEFTVGVPKNVSVRSGSLTFDLPLRAQNISSGSVRVRSADFDVIASGKFLGKALINQGYTITPNGETILMVNVRINPFDLLGAAGIIVNAFKSRSVNLSLDGIVYAEGFQLPVKESFDFTIPNL